MSHVEEKIDKPSEVQASDGMKRKRPTFLVNFLDVMQPDELVCRSQNTNSLNPKEHLS